MILATPYGPVETVRYYKLLLVDPPFAGRVTEWHWAAPAVKTVAFYVLAAIAAALVWRGRRGSPVRHRRPRDDLRRRRQRDPRSGLVRPRVHGLRPRRDRPQAREQEPRRAPQGSTSASPPAHGRGWFSPSRARSSPATRLVRGVLAARRGRGRPRASSGPDDRVFASDRFSDWMLFRIPELRGRVAYDVRFELYDDDFYAPCRTTSSRTGGLEVVCRRLPDRDRRRRRSLAHGGLPRRARRSRPLPRREITVIARAATRPLTNRCAGAPRPRTRSKTVSPASHRARAAHERAHALGVVGQDRRVARHDPGIGAVDQDPFRRPRTGPNTRGAVRRDVRRRCSTRNRCTVRNERDCLGERGRPIRRNDLAPAERGLADESRPGPDASEINVAADEAHRRRRCRRAGDSSGDSEDRGRDRGTERSRPRCGTAGRSSSESPRARWRGAGAMRPRRVPVRAGTGRAAGARATRGRRRRAASTSAPPRRRVGEQRPNDADRRTADFVVEAVVHAVVAAEATGTTTWTARVDQASPATRSASPEPASPREGVPDAEPEDREPHQPPVDIVSAARIANGTRRSESSAQTAKRRNVIANVTGWIAPTALVANPRVREVCERENAAPAARSRDGAARARRRGAPERDHRDLREREHQRRGPDDPQRREQHEQRVDVGAEPDDLLARRSVRHLERATLRRAPDRLHHVPEVESTDPEIQIGAAYDSEEDEDPASSDPQIASVQACSPAQTRSRACEWLAHCSRVVALTARPSREAPERERPLVRSPLTCEARGPRQRRHGQRPGRLEWRRLSAPRRDHHRERDEPDEWRAGAGRAPPPRRATRSNGARRSD